MKYIYQRDVDSIYKKFTKEQQIGLHSQIKGGDKDARSQVIHSCLPLVIDIAKKLYHESRAKNINPYLKAAEGELANIYLDEKQYDSAYYYSKIAFETIPNSNPHRHAYFKSLVHRKDTIELRRSNFCLFLNTFV